jgi:DNA-binding MarR family transcriptional regulator
MTTARSKAGRKPAQKITAKAQLHVDVLKKLRIVIRAAQRHSAWIEKQCGVSGAQLWIMQELHDAPGVRVGEIAERLAVHQTTVSNLLDSLHKRGLVVKERSLQDQRVVTLVLSDQGKAVLMRAPKPARGLLPEALHSLDKTSLQQLNQGLAALLNGIDGMDESYGLQPMSFTM